MDLLPQHSWHPMVIHVPLVALLLAVALDAFSAWSGSSRWRVSATLMWWVGLTGAGAAVATGLLAYNRVEHSDLAHVQMIVHRNLALASVGILLGSAIWRWRRPSSRGAAVVGIVGGFGLLGVGYLGGNLVFRHAVGVPTEVIEQVMMERGGHSHPGEHPAGRADGEDSVSDRALEDHETGHHHNHSGIDSAC